MIHLKVFENFDEVEIYINDIFEDLKDIGYFIRINKDKLNSNSYYIDIFSSINVNSEGYNIDIVRNYILTLESYMNSINFRLHDTIIDYVNNSRNPTFLKTQSKEYTEPAKHVCDRVKLITNDKAIINNITLSFYK